MKTMGGPPFSRQKTAPTTRFWVWIALSALLNLLILTVWFLLPAPEKRPPGERKLTIREDQAEHLQKRVEEANLTELRKKVAELQSIKEAMAGIHAREMAQVAGFEQTMVREAPQDVAALLRELAGIYQAIQKDYGQLESNLELYREWQPQILQAADRDTVEGLRLLPNLQPYWARLQGQADRFEVAHFEAGARIEAIQVKLEWMGDAAIREQIAGLQAPMEQAHSLHREAWSAVPASWKTETSFRFLTEDLDGKIEAIQRFRKEDSDAQAAVAKQRAELENSIAQTEAELLQVNQAFQAAEAALAATERNKNPAAWNEQREAVRAHDRSRRELERDLQNLKKTLSRTNHQPNQSVARNVKIIEDRLRHALPEPPPPAALERAMAAQKSLQEQIGEIAKTLEETP